MHWLAWLLAMCCCVLPLQLVPNSINYFCAIPLYLPLHLSSTGRGQPTALHSHAPSHCMLHPLTACSWNSLYMNNVHLVSVDYQSMCTCTCINWLPLCVHVCRISSLLTVLSHVQLRTLVSSSYTTSRLVYANTYTLTTLTNFLMYWCTQVLQSLDILRKAPKQTMSDLQSPECLSSLHTLYSITLTPIGQLQVHVYV